MSWNDDIPEENMNPPEDDHYEEPEFDPNKYYEEKYGEDGIVRRDKTELGIVLEDITRSLDRLGNTTFGKRQA